MSHVPPNQPITTPRTIIPGAATSTNPTPSTVPATVRVPVSVTAPSTVSAPRVSAVPMVAPATVQQQPHAHTVQSTNTTTTPATNQPVSRTNFINPSPSQPVSTPAPTGSVFAPAPTPAPAPAQPAQPAPVPVFTPQPTHAPLQPAVPNSTAPTPVAVTTPTPAPAPAPAPAAAPGGRPGLPGGLESFLSKDWSVPHDPRFASGRPYDAPLKPIMDQHADNPGSIGTGPQKPLSQPPVLGVGLAVIDEEQCLAQCAEYSFLLELLQDILNERDEIVPEMERAIQINDNMLFHKTSHKLKGAALNLYLPALADASTKAEQVGKQLQYWTPNEPAFANLRRPFLDAIIAEYEKLRQYLPIIEQKAEEEMAAQTE